ncbi:hypothetical protein JHK82_033774 [Glycine max]|uniref:Phosphoribulokinase/uridine kinase domain-containing protein n=1 Tax=Glycine max TaxID=3847 RepID=K7LUR9_SOYBN|nr:hypothetical protein JHK85_034490 [Glycine max]KAG5119354.1 hypothetical protein JHK82_033774 [Glycine max]KAG5140347.1 hypothetical protein JHK84_034115 [Glycine max]KAH1143117.1 hypothetical protein GYH30_033704 [Glycine max]
MSEETTSIDYVMEASSRSHFSALRLDGQVPSSATAASSTLDSTLTLNSLPNQPFVIGHYSSFFLLHTFLSFNVPIPKLKRQCDSKIKTTVGNMIIQQLHDHCVVLVNKDLFYHGLNPEELKRVHKYNFNHPECTRKLISGQGVHVPIYDFKNHQRSFDSFCQDVNVVLLALVNSSYVIILEGILVFHDQRVWDLLNMKIFVDAALISQLTLQIT